jgi:hypothetical protein
LTFFADLLPAATEPGPVDRTELVPTKFHKIPSCRPPSWLVGVYEPVEVKGQWRLA